VKVRGAGRTDAGVHAEGQTASFDTEKRWGDRSLRDALNAHLPDDLACVEAREVSDAFDPRRWAWGKHYRYRWLDRPTRSPLRIDRAWHIRRPLDALAMAAAAAHLVGRHDFSAFRAAGCTAAHPVRVIEALTVTRHADELWLDARGQGFLRHMVRIIAGSLTEVGLGNQPPDWTAELLSGRDRALAGRTAPAHGLTLVEVRYERGPPPWVDGAEAEEPASGGSTEDYSSSSPPPSSKLSSSSSMSPLTSSSSSSSIPPIPSSSSSPISSPPSISSSSSE